MQQITIPTLGNGETEWLATAITDLLRSVCGLVDDASPLLLMNLKPAVVSNLNAPIPQRWHKEQMIDEADFALSSTGESFVGSGTSPSEGHTASIRPPSVTTPEGFIIGRENQFHSAKRTHPNKVEKDSVGSSNGIFEILGLTWDSKDRTKKGQNLGGGSSAKTIMSEVPSSHQMSTSSVNDSAEFTMSCSMSSSVMDSSPKDPHATGNRVCTEFEEFANEFYEATMLRLRLPKGLPLQMQRLHEIVKGSSNMLQQLEREKTRVKQELKDYDSCFLNRFGVAPGREAKEPLRPLYMYYRRVKGAIVRSGGRSERSDTMPESSGLPDVDPSSRKLTADEKRLAKLHEEKLAIRNKLQRYQEEFIRTEGRPIRFRRDIVRIENEYKQYKQLKEHIRKLDEAIKRKKALQQVTNLRGHH